MCTLFWNTLYTTLNSRKCIFFQADGTYNSFLYTRLLFTKQPHWIRTEPIELKNNGILKCKFKFQHTHLWSDCRVFSVRNKGLIILLNDVKRAVTGGQFAVLSKDGECLGGAKITNSGVTKYALNYDKLHRFTDRRNKKALMCI